jgi:CrcB protein
MTEFLLVGAGGFLGANARYAVNALVAKYVSASLPWGTLAVNASGSFVLAAFVVWTTERVVADPAYRFLIAIGFCGAYTTFSSYAFETVHLLEHGHLWAAVGNFLLNNLFSLLGVLGGAVLVRWMFP